MTVSTADLWDDRGPDLYSIALDFTDFGSIRSFSGPARTIRCYEDNALVKSTLAEPGDGAVLIVDGGGSIATALMGDMIAEAAVNNGWVGVVINGAVRDREALSELDLGIRALASNPRKSAKNGEGEVDSTVEIGGATIRPGAMVFVDADGVVVEK
ncbi:ribonuclease E activity regulator RraA [Brevibacterium sp. GP-SGM9]|uniref:ribonuclease E activity regulator RraA n=1 Tax=Brevibacterium sp. GP-SGM9 TaxID=3376990 RepID=UPI0039A6A131